MRNIGPILIATIMLIILTFNYHSFVLAAGETEADARTAITTAENLALDCYQAALEAEKSGANITQLTTILNNAETFLSKANLAYKNGNFTTAVDFANQAHAGLSGFVTLAETLKETAIEENQADFMVNVVGSLVGSVIIIGGSVVVLFLLKGKPEKTGSEAA